jgi:hypothetical protein
MRLLPFFIAKIAGKFRIEERQNPGTEKVISARETSFTGKTRHGECEFAGNFR